MSLATMPSGCFHARYPGQVIGLRRADNFLLTGDGIVGVDIDSQRTLLRLFEKHQFASVLNCEGTSPSAIVNSIRPWHGASTCSGP